MSRNTWTTRAKKKARRQRVKRDKRLAFQGRRTQ